jgi:hypothetical protein
MILGPPAGDAFNFSKPAGFVNFIVDYTEGFRSRRSPELS